MGYHLRIQKTIEFIEGHLDEPLKLAELAEIAGFSEFHYHRVFLSMVGDPVMEYVRKRRLARAARELADPDRRIVDVALDHGFQTHETFTRAFKKMFGMTPGEYRKRDIRTPPYPHANVLQRMYNPYLGGIRMDYRIVDKPAFKWIGYALETTSEEGQNHRDIPAFWQHYISNRLGSRIPNAANSAELGICTDFDMETCKFTYLIGMEAERFDNVPEDLVCREFPGVTYAVFTTPKAKPEDFPKTIQATWASIFGEWFPHSGYEHAGAAEFELYDERSNPEVDGFQQMDIYIPIKRKGE
ncbi:AraC family transcriptional regulator [Cohnella candidum]|uniref:AraC family transcriptional regulator n=1 Tax=Cohnella candidum TaxID=2674991 RepID=A0A3G3JZT0_9BACL|nr:AraC family transcriptional regulator [Cohnella candidum]AYQ73764.1 AraC family transcriptional regulator [Cohnella candidum]